ncbi:hypothetical protein FRC17_003696 [Serendipita sp. 399]|nr:hypothetical protein FRC17_003696 [Serendipita sp. 399]
MGTSFLEALRLLGWVAVGRSILFGGAIAVLIAMAYRARKDGHTILSQARISRVALEALKYIVPAFFIAYRCNHTSFSWVSIRNHSLQVPSLRVPSGSILSLLIDYFSIHDLVSMARYEAFEVTWSMSIFLGAVADIPQYMTYYRHVQDEMDWWLVSSLGLTALGCTFYTTHWVTEYIRIQYFSWLHFSGAVVQILTFWIFFVLVVRKVDSVSNGDNTDPELQIKESNARWDQFSEAEIIVFDAEKK